MIDLGLHMISVSIEIMRWLQLNFLASLYNYDHQEYYFQYMSMHGKNLKADYILRTISFDDGINQTWRLNLSAITWWNINGVKRKIKAVERGSNMYVLHVHLKTMGSLYAVSFYIWFSLMAGHRKRLRRIKMECFLLLYCSLFWLFGLFGGVFCFM
jgi:hypothetical protein